MNTVTINLFQFGELSEDGKRKAITEHTSFLMELDDNNDYDLTYTKEEVIENIQANEYLFFADGTLAPCQTYTGKHKKAGITEFKLHGQIAIVN